MDDTRKKIFLIALIFLLGNSISFAHELHSTRTLLAPNVKYKVKYQNPGAPDELLLDAPDVDNQRLRVRIVVDNNSLVFLPTDNLAGGRKTLRKPKSLTARTKNTVNNIPLAIFVSDPPVLSSQCVVDFNDEDALRFSEASLWFDRIYVPWFQPCDGVGYVDMRPLVNGHFHVGFEDPDVVLCPSNPQAYPSRLDADDSCNFVDIPTEPRTYLTTHTQSEYIWIRFSGINSKWWNFALNQISVLGNRSVRVCYRKDQEVDLSWLTSGIQSGTVPGVWLCWSSLSPGNWDLSNWVWDVTDVKITGAAAGTGPFSLDNLHIGVQ
jgi:hypothetical protein